MATALYLDVGDDGRGIDPSAIRRTAVKAGVIEADTLAGLSDHQVLDLIFIPGLSTADAISDISGRGVGMDVVRQVIDQIGGKVSVTSQMGRGTTVRIDVPVSIATARIMVVECAGHRFGIAMDAVTETVRLSPDRVRPIKGNEGFVSARPRGPDLLSRGTDGIGKPKGECRDAIADCGGHQRAKPQRWKSTPSTTEWTLCSSRCRVCSRPRAAMLARLFSAMERSCSSST